MEFHCIGTYAFKKAQCNYIVVYKRTHQRRSRANICGRIHIDHYSAKKHKHTCIAYMCDIHDFIYIYVSRNISGVVEVHNANHTIMPTRVRVRQLLCAIRANSERFKNHDVVIGYKIMYGNAIFG